MTGDAADAGGLDPRRPGLLTLRVADVPRALAFFHDVLGLPIKLRTDGVAELQTETVMIVLVPLRPGDDADAALGWEVADVEAAARELGRRGVTTEAVRDEASPAWGRRVAFRDPDGHRFELVERPRD